MKMLFQAIKNTLQDNELLTGSSGVLADNLRWNAKADDTDKSKSNSIFWAQNNNEDMVPIYITFDLGAVPNIGKSRLAQLFIRIYDNTKTTNGINLINAKEIVRDTLDDIEAKVTHDEMDYLYHFYASLEQPVREDEAYNLNFIEVEFDVIIA